MIYVVPSWAYKIYYESNEIHGIYWHGISADDFMENYDELLSQIAGEYIEKKK